MGAPKGHPFYGGGRKEGVHNLVKREIKDLLVEHCPAAVAELVRLSTKAKSEQVRVMATKEIFDRVYGKPVQAIVGGDGKQLIPDGEHDLAMIARKVAFAFRIMAQSNEPKAIEDSGGGD